MAGKKEKKKNGFFRDFKAFITKGNILDMAVGVIIGSAFNQIVTSLVNDILMPVIGLICNTQDIADLKAVITPAVMDGETVVTPEVAIRYGAFISFIINFLIVALTLFVVLRASMTFQKKMESLRRKEAEEAPPAPPEPTVEEKTLAVLEDIKGMLAEKDSAEKDSKDNDEQ